MNKNRYFFTLLLLASLATLTAAAFAGGPLMVDPATKSAYHYDMSEPIPIYYDMGNLGTVCDWSSGQCVPVIFDNAVGKHLVTKGFGDWSAIKTSSMRTNVIGDFSKIGMQDIDATTITQIIGTSNGRGIYVVFDADGSIMQNFFGVGPNVLGISSPQFSIAGTTIITESWTVLNGTAIDPADTNAQYFQGVATHEFGHALGMAHTQTNGSAFFYGDDVGPNSCTGLPYANTLTSADVETMYPYINPYVGGTGMAQADLHTTDTLASFSDLYPGPGWPNSFGTITGKIYGVDGNKELTGVNVIARNVANPYVDSTSALSGQMTQGQLGPDGSFTLHGLKPDGQYVLYVDAIMAGGFPTPPRWFLPGAERFWDGTVTPQPFDPCHYTPITAHSGTSATANITFARVQGAPILHQLGYAAGVSGMSGDGTIAVGNFGRGGPVFRWTAKTGVVSMGVASMGEGMSISRNGQYIAGNLMNVKADTSKGAFRWDASNGWVRVAPIGHCGTDTNSAFAVSDEGSVFGYTYNNCRDYRAYRWNPNTGSAEYNSSFTRPNGKQANSRIDQVSADGSIAVGWQEASWGGWLGTVWHNGTPELITDANGDPVSEAFTVSGDGETIAGQVFDGQMPYDGSGWRRATNSTTLEYVQPLTSDASPLNPYALSGDGSVMAGFSGSPWFSFQPMPFLWTKQMGAVSLDDFVKHQGTAMEQWYSLWTPMAISDDGTTIAGWGVGFQWYGGWVLDLKKVFVCHASPGHKAETIRVAFPKDFDDHLADGDTPGRCP